MSRLALDAFVWTGEGAPTLKQHRKKLPEFMAKNRPPIDRAFVCSIFSRCLADCADQMGYQILHARFTQPAPAYTDYRAMAGSH